MKIKDEEYVYPVEVLDVLQDKEEDDLSHEQRIALENLTRHTKITDIDTLKELYSELEGVDALKDRHIYKVLEIVPQHESTVRAIFSKERVKLDDAEIESILDTTQSIEIE